MIRSYFTPEKLGQFKCGLKKDRNNTHRGKIREKELIFAKAILKLTLNVKQKGNNIKKTICI